MADFYLTIDYNSDVAFYVQLCNQIILMIANSDLHEGDNLPSVRDLAETVGINMHTVNKAYTILKQEGYLKVDRRRGTVVAIDVDKYKAQLEMMEKLKYVIAQGFCRGVTREDTHAMVDQIYDEYQEQP